MENCIAILVSWWFQTKALKMINDPESFQLLGDESRRKIVFILRAKPMTATQLAQELDLSTQTVYHHLQKLKSADMVEVVKEERVGHLIESYYQATAEVFGFTMGESRYSKEFQKKFVKMTVDSLNRIGFDLEYNDTTAQEIFTTEKKVNDLIHSASLVESVSKLDDIDLDSKTKVVDTAGMLELSDQEFDKFIALNRRIRELYLSMARKKKVN
jgi:predicted transcriptional regulator